MAGTKQTKEKSEFLSKTQREADREREIYIYFF